MKKNSESGSGEKASLGIEEEVFSTHQVYEQHLLENERRLREAERLAKLGHWELNFKSNQLHWSIETFRIFELDPMEHEPSYESFLKLIHPDDREQVRQAYDDSVAKNTQYNVYHRLILQSGQVKFVNERCRTFYDQRNQPIRSLGTILDMTDHERQIKKLIYAQLGLEAYASGLVEQIDQLNTHLEKERADLARAHELIETLKSAQGLESV